MDVRAILIGNSAYQHLLRLDAPKKDIGFVSEELKHLDINVECFFDSNTSMLYLLANKFKDLHYSPGINIFYFAGHGFQVEGNNYIVPIDVGLDDNFRYGALNLLDLTGLEHKHSEAYSVIFIDACRSIPGQRSNLLYRSAGDQGIKVKKGFAESLVSNNTLLMFSTSIGKTAKDTLIGKGISPFAMAFINTVAFYTKPINEIVVDIQSLVEKYTSSKQIPTTISSLNRLIYLKELSFPKKHVEFGRRIFSQICVCCADPTSFRSTFFSSKRYIWCDYPNEKAKHWDGKSVISHEETEERYGSGFRLNPGIEISAIACRKYFFVAGTECGKILFSNKGILSGFPAHDSEIWSIDINSELTSILFSSENGCFLFSIKDKLMKQMREHIKQLSHINSYACSFGDTTGNVYFTETSENFGSTLKIYSFDTEQELKSIEIGQQGLCYKILPIENISTVVLATSHGLIFWDYTISEDSISIENSKCSWTEYIDLAIDASSKYLAAATGTGIIEFWDIVKRIKVDEVKICVSDTRILSIAWTATNCLIATLSDETLIQVYNDEPELPTEEYYLNKYSESLIEDLDES